VRHDIQNNETQNNYTQNNNSYRNRMQRKDIPHNATIILTLSMKILNRETLSIIILQKNDARRYDTSIMTLGI